MHGISYLNAPGHTGETWNPAVGCSPASEGCANCYAQAVAHRGLCEQHRGLTDERGRWNGNVRTVPDELAKPLSWRKPRMVLTCSMGDLFHDRVADGYIAACFGAMAASQRSTFLVLTKRPDRAIRWASWAARGSLVGDGFGGKVGRALLDRLPKVPGTAQAVFGRLGRHATTLPNVLIGTTIESQARADERLPVLDKIAAMGWRTWVSAEPLLEPVTLRLAKCVLNSEGHPEPYGQTIEFVAVGAETGPRARHCETSWIRDVADQCADAGVRCHVKQLEKGAAWRENAWPRQYP